MGESEEKNIKKYTPIGVAALITTFIAFCYMFSLILDKLPIGNNYEAEIPSNSTTPSIIWCLLICISTILAIIDLATEKSRKTMAVWSLILDWGFIFLAILFIVLAANYS